MSEAKTVKRRWNLTIEHKKRAMERKAVLAPEVVKAIRSCADAGMPTREIKEKFNLPGTVISNIRHWHTYTYF